MTVVQQHRQRSGWDAWVNFAGVMMLILAVFHAMDGLVALFKDEYFLVDRSRDLVVNVNWTTWGWVHIGIAALLGLAGLSLLAGKMFGRIAGVVLAAVSAVVNVAFLAAYPVWSVVMIALDIIVIYAVIVHGRELRES